MVQADLLDVIDLLYAAAVESALWPAALEQISHAVGGLGVSMVPLGVGSNVRGLASSAVVEAVRDYEGFWWRHDTPLQRALSRGLRAGTIATDRMVMSEAEMRRDPYYQEFRRPHGLGEALAAITSAGDGGLVSICAHRAIDRERFAADDIARMTALAPHIGRAVSIATSLVEARRLAADMSSAVERLGNGVMLLDREGRVRHVNAVAERLMDGGLTIRDRAPRAAHKQDDARLQLAIAAALPGGAGALPRGVLIRRPSRRPPLYVEVVPMRPRSDALEVITFGAGGAMLLVRDLAASPPGLSQHLCDLGLTPAEARVAAAIGHGERLRDVADMYGISYETARSHLRAVFAKLGIGRQAELVALLSRLATAVSR